MMLVANFGLTAGSLSGWITLAVIVGAAWTFRRAGGGTAISSLEIANRVLEKRVVELERQAKRDTSLIAELKARTDLSVQLHPLVKWTGEHEERDQQRFEATTALLEVISDKITEKPTEDERS
jgi:hypothetical protein